MVATVTPAAALSSDQGKSISRLAIFDGHLYPGYGDANLNLGPTDVVSVDLATQTLSAAEATLLTESLWTFRIIDGQLYAPYIDPRDTNEHPDRGQYAVASAPGDWTVVTTVVGVTHAFDIAETVDGLWLFGSDETQFQQPPAPAAIIYRSTDGGATWTESLNVPGDDFARFYAVAQFGDDLIAYFNDNEGIVNENHVYLWSAGGTEWVEITPQPQQPTVSETVGPFTFNGTPFHLGIGRGKDFGVPLSNSVHGTAQKLHVLVHPDDAGQHDAILATIPTNGVYDATLAGGFCWTLGDDATVLRGDTAGNWTAVCTLTDPTVRSIAVDPDGGYLYFGTTDSRILRTPIPA
jgi:hypothetical protein